MNLVPYSIEYFEAMIELHHSAIEGIKTEINLHEEEIDLRAIDEIYLQGGGDFLIGFLDGKLIAMGGFQRLTEESAKLRRMRIHKELQGKGFGGQLLRELEKRAWDAGVRKFTFETAKARPLTLEFYRKHGYQVTGGGTYGDIETVHFAKKLTED